MSNLKHTKEPMNKKQKAKWLKALRSGKYKLSELRANMFINKIIVKNKEQCWEWNSTINTYGYGVFGINYKTIQAHRIMYTIVDSDIDGLVICHTCDNRKCLNLNHLWKGTISENNKDRAHKGRNRDQRGRLNNMNKLSIREVKQIRKLLQKKVLQRVIAKQFGVSRTLIQKINKKKVWSHV